MEGTTSLQSETSETEDDQASPDLGGDRSGSEFQKIPGINRFYPAARSWKAIAAHQLRWASLVPNRADRRRMRYGR